MSKLLFYLALVLNLLIIIVTLPIFVIGIDNEYTVGLAEKAKLFFLFENVDISMHWSSLNNESKRSFNKLIFPEGISYSLEENITTPKISKVFNVYRENTEHKGNLVELRGIEPLTSTLPV